jgi:hypothetical protein
MHDLTTQTDSEAALPDEEIKNGLMGTAQAQEVAIEQAHRRFAKPLAAFIRERVAPTFDSDEIATAVSDTFCAVARYAALGKTAGKRLPFYALFQNCTTKSDRHFAQENMP